MPNDNPIDYMKKLEGIHAFIAEVLNTGQLVGKTPQLIEMKAELQRINNGAEKAINAIADYGYEVPDDIDDSFNRFLNHILKKFSEFKLMELWNNSEYSGMSDFQEEMKSESWWQTLKEGGPITSAKAGITNVTYGKGAQKPKKPKKEEEEYPIIPDDPDFWRD